MDLTVWIWTGECLDLWARGFHCADEKHREYPVADDRGGTPADYDNYVSFLANLRSTLDSANKGYGLTITLPSSYWYLQNFDIVNLAKSVDWVSVRLEAHAYVSEVKLIGFLSST